MGESPVKEWGSLTEKGSEIDPRLQKGFDILAGDYTFDKNQAPVIVTISTQEERDALAPGTKYQYTDENGQLKSTTKR